MWQNLSKVQKAVVAALGLVFVGVIVFAVVTLLYRAGKVAVTVKYAPFSATVTLDGQKIGNNTTAYVAAGEYDLVVELEHFTTIEKKVTISEDYPYVIGAMEANTDMGRQIAAERQSEFLEVEGIFGRIAADEGAKEKEEYPILRYLPINNALFSISYAYDNNDALKINIKASRTYRDSAVTKLYTLSGVEPTDYDVNFVDFENPFEGSFAQNDASDPLEFLKNGYGTVLGDRYIVLGGAAEGNYYYAAIQTEVGQQDGSFASWRVLLERSGGTWRFVATPYPMLTKYNAKNVSAELLNKVNQLR